MQIANLPQGKQAKVCLMKDGEAYAVALISDTQTHRFAINTKMPGRLMVTVTAQNHFPYEAEIPVSFNGQQAISVTHVAGTDGNATIGSTVSLRPYASNSGEETVKGVTAHLSTSSPYITMVDSVQYFNQISHLAVSMPRDSFVVKINPDAPETDRNQWNAPCMYVTFTSFGDTLAVDTFRLGLVSPRLRIASVKSKFERDSIRPSIMRITVKMQTAQMGKGKTTGKQWKALPLMHDMKLLHIDDSSCVFSLPYSLHPGILPRAKLTLLCGEIKQDSVVINFGTPLPKPDPTLLKSTRYEDHIQLYWDAMGTASSYNIYRADSEDGTYRKLNTMPLTTRYLDDNGLKPQTAYWYKITTMNKDRQESDPSEAVCITTSYPLMMQNRPMDAEGQYLSYIGEANLLDTDYDGQMDILHGAYDHTALKDSRIAIVRPDGTEPYDLDRNVTSFTGFAAFPWRVQSTPIVADLKGNGEPSLMSLGSTQDKDGIWRNVCHSMLDKDNNQLPDTLWNKAISRCGTLRAPVVTDLNPGDGRHEKEIVYASTSSGITVLNANGTERSHFGDNVTGNYAAAVADMDGDGDKEIISGAYGAVYVWHHNGMPYLREPFFSLPDKNLLSSPVVADIDKDGEKEIVIATRNSPSHILAIKQDGTLIGSFNPASDTPAVQPYSMAAQGEGLDHGVSVGDINGDGKPEVVALGTGCVTAWDNTGRQLFTYSEKGLFASKKWAGHNSVPMLADVDGDDNIDIVYGCGTEVHAISNTGLPIAGFPLQAVGETNNSLAVGDIDHDGQNEIVAGDALGYLSAWKVRGTKVETGRARITNGFTGEYTPGYHDPMVTTQDITWQGGACHNDIIVSSGTMTIAADRPLQMPAGCNIIVMPGAGLNISGTVSGGNIHVKSGGMMNMLPGGKVM